MITIEAIYISPVKSLALVQPDTVRVDLAGIVQDRRFYVIDERGRLVTQREVGVLVQIKADYRLEPEWLQLEFPGGSTLAGAVEPDQQVVTLHFGRRVAGRVMTGDWNAALSEFCKQPVRLVQAEQPGLSYDEYPVSLLSQASLDVLSGRLSPHAIVEGTRFRPNFLLAGCDPHQEDTWIGNHIQVGKELRLQIVARDPRCVMTTLDPQTGERNLDTLRLILSYRPSTQAAYFGIYGVVEQPGTVAIGDEIAAQL